MTPGRLAVQAVIRLRRNRREPLKMLAARRRPVQAHRRCVQGHALVGAHGKTPYCYGNAGHRRLATFSQARRDGTGNRQPEQSPSRPPITRCNWPEHSGSRRADVGLVQSFLGQATWIRRTPPLRMVALWRRQG